MPSSPVRSAAGGRDLGGVSACDAEFVFVAERLDLVLMTADRKLAAAFPGRVRSMRECAEGT